MRKLLFLIVILPFNLFAANTSNGFQTIDQIALCNLGTEFVYIVKLSDGFIAYNFAGHSSDTVEDSFRKEMLSLVMGSYHSNTKVELARNVDNETKCGYQNIGQILTIITDKTK